MTAQVTGRISGLQHNALDQDADLDPSSSEAKASESAFSLDQDSLDVYTQLVESADDFLGMLAYSLYKRHKIEWLKSHPMDDHQAFKKVACTPQQVGMYRNQAEQMAKNFIDVSLEQLGEEMRSTILQEEVLTSVRGLEPTLTGKIESLRQKWGSILFNHFLGGLFSSMVAVGIFTFVSAYNKYQAGGGLEGQIQQQSNEVANPSQNPAPNLSAKSDPKQ